MGKLQDRVAIVTGASRGQGAATARLLASEGAKVVIGDVLDEEGARLADALGSSALFARLDVSDESAWTATVAAAEARWGSIDILVNNAAIVAVGHIDHITTEEWTRTMNINLMGAWLGIKAVVPGMSRRKKGAIVNISSMAGMYGMNGMAAYQASKWGLRGLSRAAAMELGPRGIRVNCVFPGGINTPMGNFDNVPVEELNAMFVDQPIHRIGEPEEVAATTLFLVSDDASYVHGAEITVDGGRTVGAYAANLPGAPGNQPEL